MNAQERWYRVKDIVDLLKVHEQTVRRWIKTGELSAYSFGGKTGYRIKERDLEVFLETRAEGKDRALISPGRGVLGSVAAATAAGPFAV